jgi:hypothetical protein
LQKRRIFFSEEKKQKTFICLGLVLLVWAFLRGISRMRRYIIPDCLEGDASTGRKHFFLKKEAKTFVHWAYASGQR